MINFSKKRPKTLNVCWVIKASGQGYNGINVTNVKVIDTFKVYAKVKVEEGRTNIMCENGRDYYF